MDEVIIDIPVNPEKIEAGVGYMRRKSTGNSSTKIHVAKVVPHYLKASTGSCHDFCKYGIKHVSEPKPRTPFRKRITATPDKGNNSAQSTNLVMRKKKSVLCFKRSPESKSQTLEETEVIKKVVPTSTKKEAGSLKKVASPGKCIDAAAKLGSDSKPPTSQSKASSLATPQRLSRRFSETVIPNEIGALQMNRVGVSSGKRSDKMKLSKVMVTSTVSKKTNMVPTTVSPSPKPLRSALSTKPANSIDPKVSHLKIESSTREVRTEGPSYEKVPEKTLYVIEPNAENQTVGITENGNLSCPSFSLSPTSGEKGLGCVQNGVPTSRSPPSTENEKVSNKFSLTSPRPPKTKDSRLTRKGTSTHRNASTPACKSEKKQAANPKVDNNKSEKKQTADRKVDNNKREKKQTADPKVDNNKGEKKQTADPKVDNKSRTRRVGRILSEAGDSSLTKLKFRRGKVVDIQHVNKSPRRIRFRSGKMLLESLDGKADNRGRSLRKVVPDGKANITKPESVKVVLRHQTVEGKKGTQSLFNKVIEETASKLVKTRKSKVKALVGAFETVISLQDTKPKTTISTF